MMRWMTWWAVSARPYQSRQTVGVLRREVRHAPLPQAAAGQAGEVGLVRAQAPLEQRAHGVAQAALQALQGAPAA